MAWVYVIKNGRTAEVQTIPPSENPYDFFARFVERRRADGALELYVIDEGSGPSGRMTAAEVRDLKYLLGKNDAPRS
ncbi:MAG: hypothetical protein WAU78_06650 [Roseiarcus sp.]